jgi:hypothetical protein
MSNERMNMDGMSSLGMNRKKISKADQLVLAWQFIQLPARHMVHVIIPVTGLCSETLKDYIHQTLKKFDPESVVKLHISGRVKEEALSVLRAESIRALSPSQMNVSLKFPEK